MIFAAPYQAYFVGGPRTGQSMRVPDVPPTLLFPAPYEPTLAELTMEPMGPWIPVIETDEYRFARPVLLYQYQGRR